MQHTRVMMNCLIHLHKQSIVSMITKNVLTDMGISRLSFVSPSHFVLCVGVWWGEKSTIALLSLQAYTHTLCYNISA